MKMQREESEYHYNEKLQLEVSEQQRKARDSMMQKELQVNMLERKIIEMEAKQAELIHEAGLA